MTVLIGTRRGDEIAAGDGNDVVFAGRGNDHVDGGAGNDLIFGGSGHDVLRGGAGSDWVDGGSGSDVLVFNATDNETARDVYLGGRGRDTLVLELTSDQMADEALRAEIAEFLCTPAWSVFHFDTLDLTVHSVERIAVRQVATAPLPVDDAATVAEDGSVTFDLLANDTDDEGAVTLVSIDATSVTGRVTDNGDGTVTYEPVGRDALADGETATEAFTYTVERDGLTATATATVTIEGTNDAPVLLGAVTLPGAEEDAGTITITQAELLAGASDADATDTLAVEDVAVAAGSPEGTLSDNGDGTYTFTPTANANGTLALDYTVTDGTAGVAQSATLEIAAVNDAVSVGTAIADASSAEDVALSVTLPEGAFTDADGDALTLTATLADGSPLPAWLAFDGATFTGTPPANFNGALDLRVTATDGPTTASQDFTLTIDPVNDPVLIGVPLLDASSDEDAAFSVVVPTGTFTDADGDAPTLNATLADGSPLPAWLAFDGATFTGTPPANFNGTLAIEVSATDGATSASQSFDLTIDPVNDPVLVGTAIADASSAEDTAISVALPEAAFTDADGGALALTATLADGGALPAWLGFDGARFTGTPPANFNGALDIEVTATDGASDASQTFTLTISPVNDAPVAPNLTLPPSNEDTARTITAAELLQGATDADGDALQINLITGPLSGFEPGGLSVERGGPNNAIQSITVQPGADLDTGMSFGVIVSDGTETVERRVSFDLTPVNDAPELSIAGTSEFSRRGDTVEGVEQITYTLPFAATDPDTGETLRYDFEVAPNFDEGPDAPTGLNGTLAASPDGSRALLTLTYGEDMNGQIEFTVRVTDSAGATDTVSRSINRFDVIDGTDGADVLTGDGMRFEEFNAGAGDDVVNAGGGEDDVYGGAGNDTINGGTNNDELFGEAGDDVIDGGSASDDLYGGAGNDMLLGGSGNDDLYGEGGNDVLTGGTGNDDFHFDLGAGRTGTDTITDFTRGEDDVWLSNGGDAAAILGTQTAVAGGFRYQIGSEALVVNVALGADDFVLA